MYPGRRFDRYAVLGDDVVIANKPVALMYDSVLKALRVKVSYQKSLVSESRAAEFAKRFKVKGRGIISCVIAEFVKLAPPLWSHGCPYDLFDPEVHYLGI